MVLNGLLHSLHSYTDAAKNLPNRVKAQVSLDELFN